MGIRFNCHACGHRLNVKAFLAGKRGVCPKCNVGVDIPLESQTGQATPAVPTAQTGAAPAMSSAPAVPTGAGAAGPDSFGSNPGLDTTPGPIPTSAPTVPTQAPVPTDSTVPLQSPAPTDSTVPTQAPISNQTLVGSTPGMPTQPSTPVVPTQPTPVAPVTPTQPKPADPIDEDPEAVWYVRPPSGGQYGPARGDIMRKWIGEGRVSADSLVWREGWDDWLMATEAFPSLGGPSTPPAPVAAPTPQAMTATAPAASSQENTSGPIRHRRKSNNSLAVVAVVVLGIMSVILLVALIMIMNREKDDPEESSSSAAQTVIQQEIAASDIAPANFAS